MTSSNDAGDLAPILARASNLQLRRVLAGTNVMLWWAEVRRAGGDYSWKFEVSTDSRDHSLMPLAKALGIGGLWTNESAPDMEEMRARSRAALASGAPGYQQQFRIVDRGKVHWLSENAAIDPIGENRWSVFGAVADITSQREIDQALKQSQEQMKAILERDDCMVWQARVVGADGRFEWHFNVPYSGLQRKIFGGERAFVFDGTSGPNAKKLFGDYALPEQAETDARFQAALRDAISGYEQEFHLVSPDRTFLVQERVSITPIKLGEWNIVGLVVDITARHEAEEARKVSQEQLAGLLDKVDCILWQAWVTKNAQGGIEWRFGSVPPSRLYRKIFGRDPTDHLTGLWIDVQPAEMEQMNQRSGRALLDGAPGYEQEFRTKSGGHEFWLREQVSIVPIEPGRWNLVGVATDVTDRKRIDTKLLQFQKLETVGKLVGGIAHEFNSILTAIIGQSELLLGDLPGGSPLLKNVTEISKAAARAAALTRQLLAFGRKQVLQPEALDLNRVMEKMEGLFRHLMGGEVATQIVPAPDLHWVKVDAGQIEQVIMNMAINAREAMPNGGKLTLETANVSVDQDGVGRFPELKPGDYVMLAITDTGTGMSPEVKARVFEPFFTTKGVGLGTGLGLSTCYGIVKQSGGHISVYSEPARGTTFKIYLPQVERQRAALLQCLDSPELPRGTETILLVEDDPALREMAGTLLKRLGYTVFTAENGIEALNLKQRRDIGHIDLLFTDVVMPHMSGKELAERMQASFPHTRILFTSAYTEHSIVYQGVLDKGVALLQKPFTPHALAHKLREVLDRKATTGSDQAMPGS